MKSISKQTYKPPVTGAVWRQLSQTAPVSAHHKFWSGLKRFLLLCLAFLIIVGGLFGWTFYRNASKLTGNKNPISLIASLWPKPLKQTNGRVNILMAGYSADDPGHDGANLTDSIMILSINPTSKSAVVISVPRDLYVNIPGFGYSKINAAYEDGGMGLLEQVVSQDFGIQFGYSTLINYTAFKDAVNAVGGVTININSPDPRGLYDPYTNLKLPNGWVKLDGQQALNLARARGDGPGSYGFAQADFDRTSHQQQILTAVKDKTAKMNLVLNPLKIIQMSNAIGSNVKADISLGELETLFSKAKAIPDDKIISVTLNNYGSKAYVRGYTTYNGQSALIPTDGLDDYSSIQNLVSKLTGS